MIATTDWQTYKTVITVGDVEYSVTANVFLRITEGESETTEHFGLQCREPWSEVEATLEGYDTLPPLKPAHEQELERLLREEIEGETWL